MVPISIKNLVKTRNLTLMWYQLSCSIDCLFYFMFKCKINASFALVPYQFGSQKYYYNIMHIDRINFARYLNFYICKYFNRTLVKNDTNHYFLYIHHFSCLYVSIETPLQGNGNNMKNRHKFILCTFTFYHAHKLILIHVLFLVTHLYIDHNIHNQ